MTPLNPWAWWLALAAVPLIAAFLIRRHRRSATVSSIEIYRRMMERSLSKRRFALPHHLLALLLSLLAMAALAMAALDRQPEAAAPRQFIVVADASASMGATELDADESRLDRLRESMSEFVGDLRHGDRLALISAATEARLMVGLTDQPADILDAMATLVPGGSGGGLSDALQIADAMCQNPSVTEIVLLSDGAALNVPQTRCGLRFVPVGDSASNLAISGLTVREADALGLNEIYVAVHNGSGYEREYQVALEMDGALVDVVSGTASADTTVEQLVRLPLAAGTVLRATVSGEGENALAADDSAWAVLRPGARVRTLLITNYPTTFLAEALILHPRVDLSIHTPANVPQDGESWDFLVIDSPYEGELPPAPHMLVLDTEYERFGVNTVGGVPEPDLIRWSFDHPLFRFVNLDGIHLQVSTDADLPEGAVSLADMPDGPLIFLMESEGRELVFFSFHPDTSDLPLRVAFVNLVANLVEWAQPFDGARLASVANTGGRLAGADASLTLRPLAGPLADADGDAFSALDTISESGVYEVVTSAGTVWGLVAANLFSPAEAALDPSRRLGIGAAQGWPEPPPEQGFPWWWLAYAAIALVLLEWMLPGLLALVRRRKRAKPLAAPSRAGASVAPTRASGVVRGGS